MDDNMKIQKLFNAQPVQGPEKTEKSDGTFKFTLVIRLAKKVFRRRSTPCLTT